MTHRPITRRHVLIGTLAAASASAVPASFASAMPAASAAAGRTDLAATRAALARYVPRYLAAMNAPGMVLALANRDGDVHEAAFGWSSREARLPVRTDHLFQIGSITKSFVALVLLQLQDEGKLDVNGPVLEHLPWLPIEQPYGPVTVHHLLTHTSGFQSESPLIPAGDRRLVPHYAPGLRFHYSNWAFDVLGSLVERLDGRPWPRAVEQRIFAPLAMNASAGAVTSAIAARAASSYVPRDDTAYPRQGALALAGPLTVTAAAGSIASTPGDMARYLTMLLNRGAGPHGRIVSERAFDAFSTPHVAAEEFGPGVRYGYGIAVDDMDGERVLRHTGGMVSFMSSLQLSLDGGYGAFASVNAQQGYRPNRVTRYALQSMRATRLGAAAPPAPPAEERDAPAPDAYLGTYTHADGRALTIAADGPRLVLVDGARRILLDHTGTDEFVAPDPAFATYTLVFEREPVSASAADGATVEPPADSPRAVMLLGYGERAYFHWRYTGPRDDVTTPELRALQGTFRSDDPWIGTLRIYARQGRLWVQSPFDGPLPLLPDREHVFRIGERESPDVMRFDSFVDGVPHVLWSGGVPVQRV